MKKGILLLAVVVISVFVCAGSLEHPQQMEKKGMKIKVIIDTTVLTATMEDHVWTRDFMSQLPLTLRLEDYNRTEKVASLPQRLSMEGAPRGMTPSVGELNYYAPWGNLCVFYRDFDYSSGLLPLGKMDIKSVKKLAELVGVGPVAVRFEIAE